MLLLFFVQMWLLVPDCTDLDRCFSGLAFFRLVWLFPPLKDPLQTPQVNLYHTKCVTFQNFNIYFKIISKSWQTIAGKKMSFSSVSSTVHFNKIKTRQMMMNHTNFNTHKSSLANMHKAHTTPSTNRYWEEILHGVSFRVDNCSWAALKQHE